MIELEREELLLLIHAAAIGRANVGSSDDVASLTKLLQRLQSVADGTA